MFKIGDWVIDTKKNISATVINILEGGCEIVYVLKDEEFYLQGNDNMIKYDNKKCYIA